MGSGPLTPDSVVARFSVVFGPAAAAGRSWQWEIPCRGRPDRSMSVTLRPIGTDQWVDVLIVDGCDPPRSSVFSMRIDSERRLEEALRIVHARAEARA